MENNEKIKKDEETIEEDEPQKKKAKIEENTNSELNEQQINVLMRERTLKVWLSILNLPAKIQLLEKTEVKGLFRGTDAKQDFLQISSLQTPMYSYEEAMIRTKDCLSIKFFQRGSEV